MANPAFGELGYAKFNTAYWDPRSDLMSYTLHDAPQVLDMSAEEGDLVFRPDFTRRNWLKSSLRKSQALVPSPDHSTCAPSYTWINPQKPAPLIFPTMSHVVLPCRMRRDI